MSKAKPNSNGQTTEANGRPENGGVDALIEQAESVKASLRDTAAKTSELIAALKRHKKHSKMVQSTLASLRQLQTLEV